MQPRLLHQQRRPVQLHTLRNGLLLTHKGSEAMRALPSRQLHRKARSQGLQEVPDWLLLLTAGVQQVPVLPCGLVHKLYGRAEVPALPAGHLLDAQCSRFLHHLCGLPAWLLQLSVRLHRVHAVSCRAVHTCCEVTGVPGLPAWHVQHH